VEAPEQVPQLFRDLQEDDPLWAEALLHAWPQGVHKPGFALAYAERWLDVEEAMEQWRRFGITISRSDVELIACTAIAAATG